MFGKKAAKSLTEEEILHVFHALWYPGPCSSARPFAEIGLSGSDQQEYFEQAVQPDLPGSLRLLLDVLSRQEEYHSYGNIEDFKHHIADYLAAIHHLAPEEFYMQIEPYFDNPKMRPTLLWGAILSSDSLSLRWAALWIARLPLLTEEELLLLIGDIGATHKAALALLQQIHKEVVSERTEVHRKLDLFLNEPERFVD